LNSYLEVAAEHFAVRRNALMESWRASVRSDPSLPEQRLRFSDEELDDPLPALVDNIIKRLRGREVSDEAILGRGAQHGRTRRAHN
jgi:hypothetical protein